MASQQRDHGGGLDAAIARFGGQRIGWIDLSTGINPHPFPLPRFAADCWRALPDADALQKLTSAARRFWDVPDGADILAAPGASLIIANLPVASKRGRVVIPQPTYNEHAAAFAAHGWDVLEFGDECAQVLVHPNNPDGRQWSPEIFPCANASLTIIDESFCDTLPGTSLVHLATRPGYFILKSFGKFWGLAGLRLGFVIGAPEALAPLRDRLGPWAVSGPALEAGVSALEDTAWATKTRQRLSEDSARLDARMQLAGARVVGGTTLFRLYQVEDAAHWQERLARHHIWSRIFPYNPQWLRLGLPHQLHWPRLEAALA